MNTQYINKQDEIMTQDRLLGIKFLMRNLEEYMITHKNTEVVQAYNYLEQQRFELEAA